VISPIPEKNERGRRRLALLALGVAVIAAAPLVATLGGDFLSVEDPFFVLENPVVRPLSPASALEAFASSRGGIYFPVTQLSYAADYTITSALGRAGERPGCGVEGADDAGRRGLWAFVFRLTNLLLHAGNSVLVFFLALRLAGRFGLQRANSRLLFALFSGVVFALHPVHVQSSAWVAGRMNLLVTLWALLGLHALIGAFARAEDEGATLFVALAVLCAVLAMLSGPPGLVVVALYLLTGMLVYRKAAQPQFIGVIGASVLIAFVAAFLGAWSGTVRFAPPEGSLYLAALSVLKGAYLCARNLLCPLWLHYPYDLSASGYPRSFMRWDVFAGTFVCVGSVALFVFAWRRKLRPVWFGLGLVGVAALAGFGPVPVRNALWVSDGALYPALAGAALLGGWALTLLAEPLARVSLAAALVLVVGVLGILGVETTRLARRWTSDEAFFAGNLALNPSAGALLLKQAERVARSTDDPASSLAPVRLAIDAEPADCAAYVRLADAIRAADYLGRDERLRRHFRVAVTIALELRDSGSRVPERVVPRLCLHGARLCLERRDVRGALRHLNEALGVQCISAEDKKEAVLFLYRLSLAFPLQMRFIRELGEGSALAKTYVGLKKYFVELLKRMPFDECIKEGDLLMEMGLAAKALIFYAQAVSLRKYDLAANLKYFGALETLNRQRCIRKMRKFRTALYKSEQGRKILKDITFELGMMYLRAREYDEADATLQVAMNLPGRGLTERLPEKIALALAVARLGAGNRSKAVSTLEKFLERNESAAVRRKLEQIR